MKGVFVSKRSICFIFILLHIKSDSHQVYARRIQNGLMPATTYQYESGGDPEAIPKLTWNELKNFHATHYHPSNGR